MASKPPRGLFTVPEDSELPAAQASQLPAARRCRSRRQKMVVDQAAFQAKIQFLKDKLASLAQLLAEVLPADSELSSDGTQRTKCPACRNPIRLGIAEADHQPSTLEQSAEGMLCPPAASAEAGHQLSTSESGAGGTLCPPAASAEAGHQPSTSEPSAEGMLCPHCKKALTVLAAGTTDSEAS